MATVTSSVLDPNRPVLPEWTRWAWASMVERDFWKPLFDRISSLREEIEWLTVIEGVRPAMYTHVAPENLLEINTRAAKHGLVVVPIVKINQVESSYRASSSPDPFNPNKPWNYRVLIANKTVLSLILETDNIAANDEVLGQVLGYPKCCRDFFHRTWGAGQVDTTWDQYAETGNPAGPVEANLLWRWMNVRWVSHLPCSYQCAETVEIGRKTRDIVKKHGYVEEAKVIDNILSWPVRWTSVNGIAEIVGPAIKVSTRTDWAPPSDNRRFHRPGKYVKPTSDLWKDNGFSSYVGMTISHAPLLEEIKTLVPQNGAIIDLGCGNGRLLRTAKLSRSDISIGGVDINENAIRTVQSGLVGKWHASKIQDLHWVNWFNPETTVALWCPVRFTEMDDDEAQKTRAALSVYKTHLVYVYGDNLQKYPLQDWVAHAGYPVDRLTITCVNDTRDVAVGVITLSED
jgi:hypothetical protein